MAQKSIHPNYHEILIHLSNGTEFKTRSTYKTAGAKMFSEVDITKHRAWASDNNASNINDGDENVKKFREKTGLTSFFAAIKNNGESK